ncbi:MAG: hypothetical protein AB7O21_14595 [Gammaproteobacteria bacterium]
MTPSATSPGSRDHTRAACAPLLDDLRQVEALTACMLEASAQADWALVGELDSRRAALLLGLPAQVAASDRARVAQVLQSALAATRQITAAIRAAQAAERASADAFRHGSRAALTYLNIAAAP